MNTRNVKFLAVLAVLAMAFAAFAVVLPAEDQDAVESRFTEISMTDFPKDPVKQYEAIKNGTYTEDITVVAPTEGNVTVYLLSGKTLSINGVSDNKTVTVIAAKIVDGKYYADASDSKVVLNLKVVDGGVKDSIKIKSTIGTESVGSSYEILGTVLAAEDVSFTKYTEDAKNSGKFKVISGSTFVYGADGYTAPSDELPQGTWFYDADKDGKKIFTIFGSKQSSVNLEEGDHFMPADAGVTVSYKTANRVSLDMINSEGTFTKGVIFNVVDSKLQILEIGKLSNANITVLAGYLYNGTGDDIENDASKMVSGVAEAGTTDNVLVNDKAVSSVVSKEVVGESAKPAYDVIIGKFAPSSNMIVNQDITIVDGAEFIIGSKIQVTFGVSQDKDFLGEKKTITVAGTLDVYGKLVGVTGKSTSKAIVPCIDITAKDPEAWDFGQLKARAGCQITGFVDPVYGTSTISNEGDFRELPAVEKYDEISGQQDRTEQTYGNVALIGEYTIPAGKTLTIEKMLSLDNNVLNVEGTLVIKSGAFVGASERYYLDGDNEDIGLKHGNLSTIKLGANGKIMVDGAMAKYLPITVASAGSGTVQIVGTSGLDFAVSKIGTAKYTAVSGTAQKISGSNESYIQLTGGMINGDLTVPSNIRLSLDDAAADAKDTILNGKTLTVSGILDAHNAFIIAKSGSVIDIQGMMIATTYNAKVEYNGVGGIKAEVTGLEGLAKEKTIGDYTIITANAAEVTKKSAMNATIVGITGYNISVFKMEYKDPVTEAEMYKQFAYIDGSLAPSTSVGKNDDPTTITLPFAVSGSNLFVAFGDELKIEPESLNVTFDNVSLIVEGKLTSSDDIGSYVVGAIYSIKDDTNTTYYAVDYNTGLSGIAGYKDATVTLVGLDGYDVDLLVDITILDKQIVDATGGRSLIIPENIVLTVNKGGSFEPSIIKTIEGKLVVMKDGSCEPATELYQVTSTDADENVTYCGFQTALNDAKAGDTIILTGQYGTDADNEKASLSIPAGVIVKVEGTLKITKTVTVGKDAKLEVTGNFELGKTTTKSAKLNVNGEMDITAGQAKFVNYVSTETDEEKIAADLEKYGMQIVSEGKFTYLSNQDFDKAVLIGVTYTEGTNTTLTSIATAIASGNDIVISGKYTTDEKVNLGNAKLTVTGEAKIGGITTEGGSIIVDNTDNENAKLTTSVTGTTGTSDSAVITLTDFVGIVEDKAVSDVYTLALASYDAGSVGVVAGELTVTDDEFTVAEKQSFGSTILSTVAFPQGSTVNVEGTLEFYGGLVVKKDSNVAIETVETAKDAVVDIAGGVTVDAENGELTLQDATISGNIYLDGALDLKGNTLLLGMIYVTETEEVNGTLTISGNLVIGESALTAIAGIDGKFKLGDGYIALFPGAIVDEDQIEELKYSDFYLNGVLFVTAYAVSDSKVPAVKADDKTAVISEVVPVIGYKMADMTNFAKWTDAEGSALKDGDNFVGKVDEFYFTGVQLTAKIKISTTTGTSIFVDGVKYGSGTELDDITVGKHTVKVTINPGYKGTTATTFDGKTISDSFNITADMVGGTGSYVLSVTGDIEIDPGVTPEPEKKSDDFGITQILLIVLVVLIAIMTVILVLRLNRA